jgi:hypothetical protein
MGEVLVNTRRPFAWSGEERRVAGTTAAAGRAHHRGGARSSWDTTSAECRRLIDEKVFY